MATRIGFLGAGLIAHLHAFGLHQSKQPSAFAGVYDPDAARTAEFAEGWGATACTSEDEVLDSCDAVYVCTWTSEHARLVDEACRRGLPVFCEKPLAFDGAGAAAMADAVDAAGVVNQVGLVLRHSPAFAYLKVVLTAFGVTMLVVMARLRAFGRLPVSAVLYVILALYGALIAYELWLLDTLEGFY